MKVLALTLVRMAACDTRGSNLAANIGFKYGDSFQNALQNNLCLFLPSLLLHPLTMRPFALPLVLLCLIIALSLPTATSNAVRRPAGVDGAREAQQRAAQHMHNNALPPRSTTQPFGKNNVHIMFCAS